MKYITTPIYYTNDSPHIGHAVTTLAADVLARFWRLKGEETFLLTGTDEHGAKIAEAAQKAGQEPQAFVDEISGQFKKAWHDLGIEPDGFIRTTDPKHEAYVQAFLRDLYEKGYVYKGTYEGWYCVGCEEFKTETQIGENRTCPIHLKALELLEEDTYLFRLSEFAEPLRKLIEEDRLKIQPESRKNEVLSFIKEGLHDVSISRKNVDWGITLPWDKEQTVYVWVDALLNYLSATDEHGPNFTRGKRPKFPPAFQLIGKDILRFHAVIWPGLLFASQHFLPETLLVQGHFTIDGQKMSKSLGNVIAPSKLIERYGVDGTRYVLLAALPFGADGDISLDRLDTIYNSALANNLGNLVNRVQAMLTKYREGNVPQVETEDLGAANLTKLEFGQAIEGVQAHINRLNKYIDDTKPWSLAGQDEAKLDTVLATLAENLFVVAVRLWPVIPGSSEKIVSLFGTSISEVDYDTLVNVNHTGGKTIAPIAPLFPRLDT